VLGTGVTNACITRPWLLWRHLPLEPAGDRDPRSFVPEASYLAFAGTPRATR
jgi:hypothetical protein